jgi:hypothetical protein
MDAFRPDFTAWIDTLRDSRPVFHSEADFQHALAWVAHLSDHGMRVRLETKPTPGMRLDLLLEWPARGTHLALELKYLTAAWAGEVDGEPFQLLSQGAQDIRAYDVLKDIQRVEQLVDGRPGWSGAVLVLTNEPSYWAAPSHGRVTNADAFRIYEGNRLIGSRSWGPVTGPGTKKGREADIRLSGDYTSTWSEYSSLPGNRGRFRLLTYSVSG